MNNTLLLVRKSSRQCYFGWPSPKKNVWRGKWHYRNSRRKYSREAVVVNVWPADRVTVTMVEISGGKRIKWQQSKVA